MAEIDHIAIQEKWQKRWNDAKLFKAVLDKSKPKFYCLEMFPYPSGSGLHMGHAFNYTIGDVYSRFKRMNGFNVLYPMGYDSFGLPAENAAIKAKSHPRKFTEEAIQNFIKQQKALGLSYDWDRMLMTHSEEYYKWNQSIFIKLFENDMVYKKKASVNWCQKCDTVLANEQVHDGCCWRHPEDEIQIRQLEQWFIKTTKYAEELLTDLEKIDWPKRIKIMQENWISKSFGTEIEFEIEENTNFVLLHGYNGSVKKDFFPYLKTELEKRGKKVSAKDLPNTSDPNVAEQVEFVLKNNHFDENTVLVGHSLGTIISLKVLEKIQKPIKKLVLAGGFLTPDFKDNKKRDFTDKFDFKFDFEKIKRNVNEIVILSDKNDYVIPLEQGHKLKEKINGDLIETTAKIPHFKAEHEPDVLNACLKKWKIFTTRPDTIYGVTFMVISAQHQKLMSLVTKEQKNEVEEFLKKIKSTSEKDTEELEKEGAFTGSYATNPLTGDKVPIYAGNFVVADYGSGMVMAVPAHDQRDYEFAKKYSIPIKVVINPNDNKIDKNNLLKAYIEDGYVINSREFSGLNNELAKDKVTEYLESKNLGKKTVQYKLRDWLISRQRYWGTPIPMIYCGKCGIVAAKIDDLPIKLPEDIIFGEGNPILSSKHFLKTRCPKCNSDARRETDTMDTFFDSSWYYLRYTDAKNQNEMFDREQVDYWLPVDQYIGGAEHACMHLVYARFFTKALRDLGYLSFDEPFLKLFNQGMLHGYDGFVMSKSRGNVVLPETISEKYGIDTARFFLLSIASPDKDIEWSDKGIEGSYRFIKSVFSYFESVKIGVSQKRTVSKLNRTIKEMTIDIEEFKYNLAIIKLRMLFESLKSEESKDSLEKFLMLLHPICPHITEELWESIGNKTFLTTTPWPKCDESKIDDREEFMEQIEMTVKSDINTVLSLAKITEPKKITIIISQEWKYSFLSRLKEKIDETRDFRELMMHVLLDETLKKHAQNIQKIIPNVLKDPKKIPPVMLDQHSEKKTLEQIKDVLKNEFKTEIEIVVAEESTHAKAQASMPSKPAIVIE